MSIKLIKKVTGGIISAVITAGIFTAVNVSAALSGDANGDGKFDVRDAAYIARMVAKGQTGQPYSAADYNRDGKVNIRDAAAIIKYFADKNASINKNTSVKKANYYSYFANTVTQHKKNNSDNKYILFDVDGDGVKELVVSDWKDGPNQYSMWKVYKYNTSKGKTVCAGSFDGIYGFISQKGGKLYSVYNSMSGINGYPYSYKIEQIDIKNYKLDMKAVVPLTGSSTGLWEYGTKITAFNKCTDLSSLKKA